MLQKNLASELYPNQTSNHTSCLCAGTTCFANGRSSAQLMLQQKSECMRTTPRIIPQIVPRESYTYRNFTVRARAPSGVSRRQFSAVLPDANTKPAINASSTTTRKVARSDPHNLCHGFLELSPPKLSLGENGTIVCLELPGTEVRSSACHWAHPLDETRCTDVSRSFPSPSADFS